jgi:hypothetical protein
MDDLFDTVGSIFDKDEEEKDVAPSTTEVEYVDEVANTASAGGGGLQDTVESAQGGLEKLIRNIPGYKGYKDKELRREADKLLRMDVALRFDDERKRLVELQNQLVSQAKIEFVDDLERAVMKLQHLIDRIKTATYGYAGLFDAVKVKEEQLDALYEFDNRMLGFVDEVASDVDHLASAISTEEGIGGAINELVSTVAEANMAFDHREEAVLQAGKY